MRAVYRAGLKKKREDLDAARVEVQLFLFGTGFWGLVAVLLSLMNAARASSLSSFYPAFQAVAGMFWQ